MVRRSLLLAFALALMGAISSAQQAPAPARVAGNRPDCVSVGAQAVFNGSGYNHLVTISNACPASVTCQVTTNINPQATSVTVARSSSETINTYFNAAGYGFSATVHCHNAAR
jgi:hypothetical protein